MNIFAQFCVYMQFSITQSLKIEDICLKEHIFYIYFWKK